MLIGFVTPWIVMALVLALHIVVPARRVRGYVRDPATGEKLRYRLNGLRVFGITVLLWEALCAAGLVARDHFYVHRVAGAAGACTAGLVFTLAIVLRAPPTGRGLLADLYFGRLENPQWKGGFVDAKMWLYLVGAVLLGLNVLSFAAHHAIAFPRDPSPGVRLYAVLFTFFLCEYLFFEEVHLYTYDFFAERVGFKLGWGCLTFYPYFYCVGLWSAAGRSNAHARPALLVFAAALFASGWVLSRGANLQKFTYKTRPNARFLGVLYPEVVSDGERALLVNGFWGLSRHINYLGEILMAAGLTLALGRTRDLWAWLYPLYYVALLFPRQADDDRRCAQKYGALWDEYRRRVPWRIIPWVY